MEIFQTIWMALTTPNEGLINILSIPLTIIELTVGMLLFTTVLNINATKKQKAIYLSIICLWSVLSNTPLLYDISKFVNALLCPILVIFIFKTSILKGIFAEILPLIIIVIFEPIYIKLLTSVFGIQYNDISYIPIYRISVVLALYLSMYILYRIFIHFNFSIKLLDNMDKKSKTVLIINSAFGIISICTQLYLFKFYSENMSYVFTIISLISLIAYFFISMYSLTKTTQLQITEQNLEEAQLYNKSLKILHDNVRAFKHDFSNIVQAIGGYIGTNDMEGLKTYYSQLLGDCQKVNNLYTLSPEVINNPAIYSLLTSKYHKADELGIKINLEVFLNLNELNMKIYEFTRALGILMDNAIEAASECDEKIINVEIRKDFKVNRQLLIIENTYKEKNVDLDKIYEKGYSSKPNNTGLGLWEVRQIMKKNNNLNLYTTKNDTFFNQQLEIYTK